MKKGKETSSKWMPLIVTIVVCICTVLGFGAKQKLQGGLMKAPVSQAGTGSGILYSVLEIEPGWDYMYDEADKKNALATALGTTADKISFKYVSTPEFNGMNEDLVASYDIIVFGLNTGTMNKIGGNTVYNDRDLDGYIYLAYGDLVKYDNRMSGMSVYDYICIDDYVNGVDGKSIKLDTKDPDGKKVTITIDKNANAKTTNWKAQWTLYNMDNPAVWTPGMQDYFSGQYYVLVDIDSKSWSDVKAYYNDPVGNARFSGNDITKKKVEELLDFVSTGRPVVLADKLYTCVNDNNTSANSNKSVYPTANMYSFLKQINGKENVVKLGEISTKLKAAIHTTTLEIVTHTMQYQNSSAAWVSAPNIAYDSNGLIKDSCVIKNIDKFRYTVDFKAEIGKSYYVKAIVDKDTDGRFDSVATVDDFNEVYYAEIVVADEAVEHVELDINLAENYNGMFGWQLLVEELDASRNPIDRVSVEGHTVVKGATKYIKVLQLLPNGTGNLKMSDESSDFKKELNTASGKIGYNISITAINVDTFEDWFRTHPYDGYKGANDYLHINGYTMLVIGFVDSYNKEDISDDFGALSCVEDFISNGNSVLFSHDTMHFPVSGNMGISSTVSKKTLSLTLQKGWKERAGTIMALGMRDMFGMDRYDVTSIPNYNAESLAAANVPQNKNGQYITETQGFTNMFLLWLNNHRNYLVDQRPNTIHTLVFNKNITEYDSQYNQILTKRVEEINQGQITMYPYKVTSTGFLDVNTTHGQYYQLDLEDDDIVVWYTLAKNTSGSGGDIYNDTRRDAANNYYIYSKGNITYTGAGHSSIADTNGSKTAGGLDEVRLFVNTVIRTAAAGNFVPQVKCVNGFTTRNANTYVVNPKPFDKEYLVQFEAFDEDLATLEVIKHSYPEEEWNDHVGRFASGAIYWIDASGTLRPLKKYNRTNPDNYLLNKVTTDFTIYNPLDRGKTMEQINADMYLKNMYECYMLYQEKGTVELRVEATDYYNETGTSTIHVTKQELFDLD